MTKINEAILRTLIYADLFDYPLTVEETWRFLLIKKSSKEEIKKAYRDLRPTKEYDGFYFLKGREKIVGLRKKRQKWSQKKLKIAEKTAKSLKLIPWVKMIGITGGLAILNSDKNDDIDLLIVSAPKRLWLTRFLVTFLVSLAGKRRQPGETQVKDKICLNMFLDEEHLRVPKKEQDLFSAHEICQMRPLYDKDKTSARFFRENQWAKKYLPNASFTIHNIEHEALNINRKRKFKVADFVFNLVEALLKLFQLWFMRKRRTTEVITEGILRFHPQDSRDWIFKEYAARLQKRGLDKF